MIKSFISLKKKSDKESQVDSLNSNFHLEHLVQGVVVTVGNHDVKLKLSTNFRYLSWRNPYLGLSYRKKLRIDTGRIIHVLKGQSTSTFPLLKKQHLTEHSLSIIYLDEGEKSFDIIITKKSDYDCVYKAITTIIEKSTLEVILKNSNTTIERVYIDFLWNIFTYYHTSSQHVGSLYLNSILGFSSTRKKSEGSQRQLSFSSYHSNHLSTTSHHQPALASRIIHRREPDHDAQPNLHQQSSKPAPKLSKFASASNLFPALGLSTRGRTRAPARVEIKENGLMHLLTYINYKRPLKTTYSSIVHHLFEQFDNYDNHSLDRSSFSNALKYLLLERDDLKNLWNEIINIVNIQTSKKSKLLSTSKPCENFIENNHTSSSSSPSSSNKSLQLEDYDHFSSHKSDNSAFYHSNEDNIDWSQLTYYFQRTYTVQELKQLYNSPSFLDNKLKKYNINKYSRTLIDNKIHDSPPTVQKTETTSFDMKGNDNNCMNMTLSFSNLVSFWRNIQKEDNYPKSFNFKSYQTYTEQTTNQALFSSASSFNSSVTFNNTTLDRLNYGAFMNLLMSPDNELFDPRKQTLCQNMNFPLTYYYIASSHNTYLEGGQLTSTSAVKRYIDDLLCGCRCVEIDIWNGDDGEPCVYHGHTLTTKISFRDVIQAIKENAFISNPYPVILSLEIQCDMNQQIKMAEILEEYLSDSIVTSDQFLTFPDNYDFDDMSSNHSSTIQGSASRKSSYHSTKQELMGVAECQTPKALPALFKTTKSHLSYKITTVSSRRLSSTTSSKNGSSSRKHSIDSTASGMMDASKLLIDPVDMNERYSTDMVLQSPEELKYKFILKGKRNGSLFYAETITTKLNSTTAAAAVAVSPTDDDTLNNGFISKIMSEQTIFSSSSPSAQPSSLSEKMQPNKPPRMTRGESIMGLGMMHYENLFIRRNSFLNFGINGTSPRKNLFYSTSKGVIAFNTQKKKSKQNLFKKSTSKEKFSQSRKASPKTPEGLNSRFGMFYNFFNHFLHFNSNKKKNDSAKRHFIIQNNNPEENTQKSKLPLISVSQKISTTNAVSTLQQLKLKTSSPTYVANQSQVFKRNVSFNEVPNNTIENTFVEKFESFASPSNIDRVSSYYDTQTEEKDESIKNGNVILLPSQPPSSPTKDASFTHLNMKLVLSIIPSSSNVTNKINKSTLTKINSFKSTSSTIETKSHENEENKTNEMTTTDPATNKWCLSVPESLHINQQNHHNDADIQKSAMTLSSPFQLKYPEEEEDNINTYNIEHPPSHVHLKEFDEPILVAEMTASNSSSEGQYNSNAIVSFSNKSHDSYEGSSSSKHNENHSESSSSSNSGPNLLKRQLIKKPLSKRNLVASSSDMNNHYPHRNRQSFKVVPVDFDNDNDNDTTSNENINNNVNVSSSPLKQQQQQSQDLSSPLRKVFQAVRSEYESENTIEEIADHTIPNLPSAETGAIIAADITSTTKSTHSLAMPVTPVASSMKSSTNNNSSSSAVLSNNHNKPLTSSSVIVKKKASFTFLNNTPFTPKTSIAQAAINANSNYGGSKTPGGRLSVNGGAVGGGGSNPSTIRLHPNLSKIVAMNSSTVARLSKVMKQYNHKDAEATVAANTAMTAVPDKSTAVTPSARRSSFTNGSFRLKTDRSSFRNNDEESNLSTRLRRLSGRFSAVQQDLNQVNGQQSMNNSNEVKTTRLLIPTDLCTSFDENQLLEFTGQNNVITTIAAAPTASTTPAAAVTTNGLPGSPRKRYSMYMPDTEPLTPAVTTRNTLASVAAEATRTRAKKLLAHWAMFHKTHFSRAYPSGIRIDSSNFDPGDAWAAGTQLTALNYQTNDIHLRAYKGKFRENGGVGYVLKPEYLLNYPFMPNPSQSRVLVLTIMSASQLPKYRGTYNHTKNNFHSNSSSSNRVISPSVTVTITGQQSDKTKWTTKTVSENGFNPVWSETKLFKIENPNIAVITFEVRDEDSSSLSMSMLSKSKFIAGTSMPVSCMREGIRSCALADEYGNRLSDFMFPSLLVYVQFINENETSV